jgi:hypothetical protein
MLMITSDPAMPSPRMFLTPFGIAVGSLGAEGSMFHVCGVTSQALPHLNPKCAMPSPHMFLTPFGVAVGSLEAKGSVFRVCGVMSQTLPHLNHQCGSTVRSAAVEFLAHRADCGLALGVEGFICHIQRIKNLY